MKSTGDNREKKNRPLPLIKRASCPDMIAVNEKTICYCSSFDLNFEDWFASYQNLRTFIVNLQNNLVEDWHRWFSDAIDVTLL
jgi:hypothetical protein